MQFEKTMTRHGSSLYVYSMPHVESVAVGVHVNVGTCDEDWPKQAGIAHALEHMLFQGNKRRPDSKSISSDIEDCGGSLNAYTNKNTTFYHRIVPSDALGVAVDSLASQVTEPLFRQDDINKEMKNILQEILGYEDSPGYVCGTKFDEIIYGDHPLGRNVLGTEEAVENFTRGDFLDFHGMFYYPENYVFIVVGNTTLKEAEKEINAHLFGTESFSLQNVRPNKPCVQGINKSVVKRDIKQAHVYMGVLIGGAKDPDTQALGFYASMIGGGMSFPLFQEIRDKLGLCYSIGAGVEREVDHGSFYVAVDTDPDRIEEALSGIEKVIFESVDSDELFVKARKSLLGKNAIKFASPSAVLSSAAHYITLEGRPKSPADIKQEIEAQTHEGVRAAASTYLLDHSRYMYSYVVPNGTDV